MNSIYKRTALIFASSSVLVLAGCGGGGGDSAPATATAPAAPTLTDSAQARAFFVELRTTLSSLVNTYNTGFVHQVVQRMADDFKVNVAPTVRPLADQVTALDVAIRAFEDAKAGVGFSAGLNPFGNSSTQVRVRGNQSSAIQGNGSYDVCWTESADSVTCMHTGPLSADLRNGRVRPVAYTITSNGAGSYHYLATQFTQSVSSDDQLTVGAYVAESGTPGTGGITTIYRSANRGELTINGTLPPSSPFAAPGIIALAATFTASGDGSIQYAANGTLSTTIAGDTSKVASFIIKPGSEFMVYNSPFSGDRLMQATVLATVETNNTRFDGTLNASGPAEDYLSAVSAASMMSFDGVMTDLTTNSVVLNGTLTAEVGTSNPFVDRNVNPDEAYLQAELAFEGTVQAPSRPALSLSLSAVKTGLTSRSVMLEYGYGSTVIKAAGVYDSADPSGNRLSINNQDGITADFNLATQTGNVTKGGNRVATIKDGAITYVDGVTESLK